jgi:acyl carrier protein
MTNQAGGDVHERALAAVCAALGEVDAGRAVPGPAPETVLLGDGGLDSLAFVTFAVALEERLQRTGWTVSVIDLVSQDTGSCTVDGLAGRIAASVAGDGG